MIYLDHAATTAMLPEAALAMSAEFAHLGNPSSLHGPGRRARRVVEESREIIAGALGAAPSEVIFTSGGTEADNLALKGLFWARRTADPRRRRILLAKIEHHAVLDSAQWLAEREGAVIDWLPVDSFGRMSPEALGETIGAEPETVALISVMWANNEVGTVQPVAELAALSGEHGIPFHTDAVQAVAHLPADFAASGVNAMTVTGHKLGGPVGTGALLLAKGTDPVPVLHGGGQERDVRSGTLDTAGIAGFAAAVSAAIASRDKEAARLAALRDDLIQRVLERVPGTVLNGDPEARLPGNAHLSFLGCDGDALLMLLDAEGIACSTGSACSAGVAEPSHVLLAMGADRDRASGSLRFSLGRTTVPGDVDALAGVIAPVVERARRAARS